MVSTEEGGNVWILIYTPIHYKLFEGSGCEHGRNRDFGNTNEG